MSDDRIWYYAEGDQRKGPVDEAALLDLVHRGGVTPRTLVWTAGMENWADADAAFAQHGLAVQWPMSGGASGEPPVMPKSGTSGSQLRSSMRQGQQGAMFGAGATGGQQGSANAHAAGGAFDAGGHPIGMISAVKTVLRKYATFSGRARRPEYWWFILFTALVSIPLSIIDLVVFNSDSVSPLDTIFNIAMLLPSLGVGARRLHDTGRSGWWQLLALIPIIGWIVLIWWYTRPGEPQENRFGPA